MAQHVVPADEWMDLLTQRRALEERAEKAEADLAQQLAALRTQAAAATRLAEAQVQRREAMRRVAGEGRSPYLSEQYDAAVAALDHAREEEDVAFETYRAARTGAPDPGAERARLAVELAEAFIDAEDADRALQPLDGDEAIARDRRARARLEIAEQAWRARAKEGT